MGVPLPRTETALEECRAHLAAVRILSPSIDTASIEAYLARHIAVLLCAEIESTLTAYVDEKIDGSGCSTPAKNIIKSLKKVARSAKVADIADVIAQFGPDFKTTFQARLEALGGEETSVRLGNVVVVRDATAHSTPPSITLAELELAATAGGRVLQAVRTTLDLPEIVR